MPRTTAASVDLRILDRLEREVVAQAFTVWAGYEAFCAESAVVPAEKLAAVVLEPIMDQIEDLSETDGATGGRA